MHTAVRLRRFAVAGLAAAGCGLALAPPVAADWVIQPSTSPAGTQLQAESCPSTTACRAVGYTDKSGTDTTSAEHWNGKAWSVLPTPNPSGAHDSSLDGVSCVSASVCDAVGNSLNGSNFFSTLIERWNGQSWSINPSPTPTDGGALAGVSCVSASACTAVGGYTASGGAEDVLIERWNGTNWSIQAAPSHSGSTDTFLSAVSCGSGGWCVAVGSYYVGSGLSFHPVPFVERFNGTKWSVQSSPNPTGGGGLNAVSCATASACTAVGGPTVCRFWLSTGTARSGRFSPPPIPRARYSANSTASPVRSRVLAQRWASIRMPVAAA